MQLREAARVNLVSLPCGERAHGGIELPKPISAVSLVPVRGIAYTSGLTTSPSGRGRGCRRGGASSRLCPVWPVQLLLCPVSMRLSGFPPRNSASLPISGANGTFLFIDEGSTDGTFRILSALLESAPGKFEVLRLPTNSGKGEAIRRGMLLAFQSNPEYVGYWDADLATHLDAIPMFAQVFRDRPATEIVLEARVKLLGRDIQRQPIRHYLGRVFATAVAVMLGIEVYDSQCGAKLFRVTERVRAVFETPFLSRWIFDVGILARFMKLEKADLPLSLGTSLYELPVPVWHDVAGSKLRMKDFVRAAYDLVRIHCSSK